MEKIVHCLNFKIAMFLNSCIQILLGIEKYRNNGFNNLYYNINQKENVNCRNKLFLTIEMYGIKLSA